MKVSVATPMRRLALAVVLVLSLLIAPASTLLARAAGTGTLTAPDTPLVSGEKFTLSYTADQPLEKNWVGVYPRGVLPGDPQGSTQWHYTPEAAGEVSFVLPAGEWDAYLLADDGYDVISGPLELTVESPPAGPANPIDTTGTDGVLYRESFDSLTDVVAAEGTTHTTPAGWSAQASGDGNAQWQGWTFTTREQWSSEVDRMRFRFGRAQDVIAVADPSQFGTGAFGATLESAPVTVAGQQQVVLSFDSHYRQAPGQRAVVTVSFDGGPEQNVVALDADTVTNDYDGLRMNGNETHTIEVPADAKQATFRWQLTAEGPGGYWAIDSVAVHQPITQQDGATSLWVVSDIQGNPWDLAHGLRDLKKLRPDGAALLMVGDIVNAGSAQEWAEIHDVMEQSADIVPQVVAAIGNHESYTKEPWETHLQRFLDFAQRDKVWGEYLIEGNGGQVPVLVLGQEDRRPPEVSMSEEQVQWLDERLDHWSAQRKQVIVISHFPLGDTHSASWLPWYHDAYQYNDRLTQILADHPNAIMFNGHTHYPAELGDWAVQRRAAGGHPDGFWAINTLAMHIEWDAFGEDTATIEEKTTRDINRGLTVDVHPDRVVVKAHDFGVVPGSATDGKVEFGDNDINTQLREVVIANPFVQPAVESDDPVDEEDPAPAVTVSPDVVQQGQQVTFTASDYQPGEKVVFAVHSETITLPAVVADSKGVATVTWQVPGDFELGAHKVSATGATSGAAQAPFTVVSGPAPAPEKVPTGLPDTGLQQG